jgi:RimJ/RimL family protein N-acetyltransferase
MSGASAGRPALVLETERLFVRRLTEEDAEFIFGLVNEPSFLENIGDRGVRTLDDARAYIRNGPLASYTQNGFGLWLVLRKEDDAPIGMCGLLRRDTLPDVDIGFAFRPAYWRQGYAVEAGSAVLAHGRAAFGLTRIVAIVAPANQGSIRVLEKLDLTFERMIQMPGDAEEIRLYAVDYLTMGEAE